MTIRRVMGGATILVSRELQPNVPLRCGGRDKTEEQQDDVRSGAGHDAFLSIHHEVDPAIGNVVFALHEPVETWIERTHDVVLNRVPDQLVITLDKRS